jgi:hypothetical protein
MLTSVPLIAATTNAVGRAQPPTQHPDLVDFDGAGRLHRERSEFITRFIFFFMRKSYGLAGARGLRLGKPFEEEM